MREKLFFKRLLFALPTRKKPSHRRNKNSSSRNENWNISRLHRAQDIVECLSLAHLKVIFRVHKLLFLSAFEGKRDHEKMKIMFVFQIPKKDAVDWEQVLNALYDQNPSKNEKVFFSVLLFHPILWFTVILLPAGEWDSSVPSSFIQDPTGGGRRDDRNVFHT